MGRYEDVGTEGAAIARAVLDGVRKALGDGKPAWPLTVTVSILRSDGAIGVSQSSQPAPDVPGTESRDKSRPEGHVELKIRNARQSAQQAKKPRAARQ